MRPKQNRARPILCMAALFLLTASAAATAALHASAAPAPTSVEPTFVQGSSNYITAPTIVYNVSGAFWGGLTIGLIQQLSTLVLPNQLQNAAIFVVFLLIVMVRPQGLFGRATERV